jgi:hypothetical protein
MAALLTVAEFCQYVKESVPAVGEERYTLISALIDRASDNVKAYVGGPIINETISNEKHDSVRYDEIFLRKRPIVSIQSVLVDGVNETANIEFDPERGSIFYADNSLFPRGRRIVSVSYTAGYGADANAIPQDIKQAALLIAQFWYKRDVLDYSENFGESQIITGQLRFPTGALRILDRYKTDKVVF